MKILRAHGLYPQAQLPARPVFTWVPRPSGYVKLTPEEKQARKAERQRKIREKKDVEIQAEIDNPGFLCQCVRCETLFMARKRKFLCSATCRNKFKDIPAPGSTVGANHLSMLRKRRLGIYDTPKLTSYALGLLATRDPSDIREDVLSAASHHNDQRISVILDTMDYGHGLKIRNKALREPYDTIDGFYFLGSAYAAGHPRRSLDRGRPSALNI